MKGKNKFNIYVASSDYPLSYSSMFLKPRSLVYDMGFSSIVTDEYGTSQQLDENSFTIAVSLTTSGAKSLIRLECLDLPNIDFGLDTITVDDYFRQFYK